MPNESTTRAEIQQRDAQPWPVPEQHACVDRRWLLKALAEMEEALTNRGCEFGPHPCFTKTQLSVCQRCAVLAKYRLPTTKGPNNGD